MATFTEQFHLDMPPPGWLHINGVSLSTDVHQQSPYTSDQQTKHVLSPPMPFTTMSDKQYQKFENSDMPKKLFIDRQIKKAKSLPGLIKGTALSHNSAPYVNTAASSQDDPLPINDNDSSRTQRTSENRRPRVSFSDFNKVQFFEDSNDNIPQSANHRQHHRHRSSKKTTNGLSNNQVSPPSIQHTQSLYTPYRPLSRQQPVGHELNIRKQQLNPSPRVYSSRTAHLPDILNQSLSTDYSNQDKYVLQRERSFFQIPEPAADLAGTSSAEMSRENTRAGGARPTAPDNYDQYDNQGTPTLFNSGSNSSSLGNRQRPSLRTISLRQQFCAPLKAKPIQFSNNNSNNQTSNTRRSASLKHMGMRNQSADDDHDDPVNQQLDNRPVTGISNPSKHLRRNYIIHFNPKNPFNGNSTMDYRSNTHESPTSSQERFQSVLKIVRPPYISSLQNSPADSVLQPTTNQINGSRSSRNNSAHGPHEYHLSSNTISV